jgi:hypothetical protein
MTGGYPDTFSTAAQRQLAARHTHTPAQRQLAARQQAARHPLEDKPKYPSTRILKTAAEKIEEDNVKIRGRLSVEDYIQTIRQWTYGDGLDSDSYSKRSSIFWLASKDFQAANMNLKKDSTEACISKFNEFLRERDTENIIPEGLLQDGHTAAGYRFKKKRRRKTRPRSRKKSRKKSRRRKTRSKRLSR